MKKIIPILIILSLLFLVSAATLNDIGDREFIFKGINKDNVFTELISNKADIAGGEAVFKLANPFKELDLNKTLFFDWYIANGVGYNFYDFYVGSVVEEINPVYEYYDVNYTCYYVENITLEVVNDTCLMTLKNQTGIETTASLVWSKETIIPKGTHMIKFVATWDAHLGPQNTDWFPDMNFDADEFYLPNDIKFTKFEWEWFNTSWGHYKEYTNLTGNITYMFIDAAPTDNADFNDTRFLSCYNDSLVFNHTLEATFGTSGQFRVNNLGENCTRRYYNNSDASSTSSASDVYFEPTNAYYFDANANDSVGGNDGSVNGASLADGYINGSYSFITNDDIDLGTPLIAATGAFAVNAWVKTPYSSTADKSIFSQYQSGHPDRTYMAIQNGAFIFAAGATSILTDQGYPDDEWFMVTFVRESNGSAVIYLNGDVEDTGTVSGNVLQVNSWIGSLNGVTFFMDGEIDEVIVYNKSITQQQTIKLYTQTAPNFIEGAEQNQTPSDQPPVVVLNSPANDSTQTIQYVIFNTTVTDDFSVQNVSLYIDGTLNQTNTSQFNGTYIFNVSIPESNHNWSILAYDNASQSTQSETRFFISDFFDPIITIDFPIDSTEYNFKPTTLNTTASDTHLEACWYSLDNFTTNTTFTCNTDVTGLLADEGVNYWRACANDSVGNEACDLSTFEVDTIIPFVNITAPENTTYNSVQTQLNYTYNDSNPDSCWYSLDLGSTNSTSVAAGTNFTGLSSTEGLNNWTVYCNDTFSNENSSVIYFTQDTIAPQLEIIVPQNITYSTTSLTFEISGNEELSSCFYSLDNFITNVSMDAFNSTNYRKLVTGLSDGQFRVDFLCNDSVNNSNSSFVYFTVDTLTSTLLSPEDNFVSGTISNNFSGQITSSGSAIQNSSLYVKQFGGSWAATDTIIFQNGDYTLDIYADALTETDFEINNVNATEISSGVWRINSSEVDYNTQRAQVMKTLFYGTDGTDARILLATSVSKIISNDIRDTDVDAYYFKITTSSGGNHYTLNGNFTNNATNNVSTWVRLAGTTAGNQWQSRFYLPEDVLVQDTGLKTTSFTLDNIGTNNSDGFYNPGTFKLISGDSSVNVATDSRILILSKETINLSDISALATVSYVYYNENHSIPPIEYNGLSNFTVNFTEDVINSADWNIEVCNSDGTCELAISNRSIYLDRFNPTVQITFPEETSYITDVSTVNFTLIDDDPDSCWYSNDSGPTNFTSVPAVNGSNYLNITSKLLQNTITVYCNDTNGNEGSDSVTYTLDAIRYTSNSDPTNTSVTGVGNVFINVTVNPIADRQNISFRGFNLTNGSITQYLSNNFTNSTNFTTLVSTTNPFYWDVILYDTNNVSYTVSKRYKGFEEINFSLNGTYGNIIVELGADIDINATSNISYVYIDIDHPEYGINYSSGFLTATLELIIDYFRSTVFNDSTISKVLEFVGTEIKTLFFPAHQYDEVDNMSINISGTNTTQYPENVQINKSNLTLVDRIFPGYLIGNNIYLNKLNTEAMNASLFYSSLGPQSIEFFMDDGATFNELSFDISGLEFGFDYEDEFNDTSVLDIILNEGMFRGGFALPKGTDLLSFVYESFPSSGTLDSIFWSFIANGVYYGGGDDFEWTIDNNYVSNNMVMSSIFSQDFSGTNSGSRSVDNYAYVNFTKLNIWTTQEIDFKLSYSRDANEDKSFQRCDSFSRAYIGTILAWESPWTKCEDSGGSGCTEGSESIGNLTFNLERNVNNSWNLTIDGSEKTFGDDINVGNCGSYVYIYNYTNGSLSKTYQFPGSPCVFDDEVSSLSNTSIINNLEWNTVEQFKFVLADSGTYDADTSDGCSDTTSSMTIYFLNHSVYNLTNSSIISNPVFTSSGDITDATLSLSACVDCASQESGSSVFPFLSADNGDNYESVTQGVQHSFTFPGTDMKYKYDFNLSQEGYILNTPFLLNMSINTPRGFPSDLTFDFGGDGVTDASFSGEINNSNSPTTITISSADLFSAFTGFTEFDHLFEVPLKITSDSVGELFIDNFNLTYNPNPVFLNSTSILSYLTNSVNFVDFPISIESIGGNITVDDIRYDYAGGNDTIEVLAHNADYSQNLSRNITYYYSRWDYSWIPSGVEWIYFSPPNPDSLNVTPYGQTSTTPILNVTNYGYGGKNATLSVYQSGTSNCTNVTMSITNSKEDGFLLNESFIELTNLSYLEAADIYMWADYNCTFDTWHLYKPSYYFRQCVDGGICSTDLI